VAIDEVAQTLGGPSGRSSAQRSTNSMAISGDTSREVPRSVSNMITRSGLSYWPDSRSRIHLAMGVVLRRLAPGCAEAAEVVHDQIDVALVAGRHDRGGETHTNSTFCGDATDISLNAEI